MIHAQGQDAEHQMVDLQIAPDPHMVPAEFVFQARVHPLGHGALAVAYRAERLESDLLAAARLCSINGA